MRRSLEQRCTGYRHAGRCLDVLHHKASIRLSARVQAAVPRSRQAVVTRAGYLGSTTNLVSRALRSVRVRRDRAPSRQTPISHCTHLRDDLDENIPQAPSLDKAPQLPSPTACTRQSADLHRVDDGVPHSGPLRPGADGQEAHQGRPQAVRRGQRGPYHQRPGRCAGSTPPQLCLPNPPAFQLLHRSRRPCGLAAETTGIGRHRCSSLTAD